MRIISGNLKGRKILTPDDIKTRPLKDLTKESIFNILKHSSKFNIRIKNSVILDLFAGVGSFGIECLSNGAKHVTFVENYSSVLPILEKNLARYPNEKKNINDAIEAPKPNKYLLPIKKFFEKFPKKKTVSEYT